MHSGEVANKILQERRTIRRMTDLCRHDERHPTASLQEARGSDEEQGPRRTQTAEVRAELRAQSLRALAHLTLEGVITDKRWIPYGTLEPLRRLCGPREEVPLMHQRAW